MQAPCIWLRKVPYGFRYAHVQYLPFSGTTLYLVNVDKKASIWNSQIQVWFFCCVEHSFAYVAHFVFLRDVWIRSQKAAAASRRATTLSTHLPICKYGPIRSKMEQISLTWLAQLTWTPHFACWSGVCAEALGPAAAAAAALCPLAGRRAIRRAPTRLSIRLLR
jgi:hypothetical protein